jgi:hypothetical protein
MRDHPDLLEIRWQIPHGFVNSSTLPQTPKDPLPALA